MVDTKIHLIYNTCIVVKKEFKMGFEKVVLDKVAKVLKDEKSASFEYGTLFVNCTEDQARKVFHKLSKDYGFGKVRVSKTPLEFAYDFV
jgi:hypothetical protein